MSASSGGLAMDVDHNVHVVKALDGDTEKPLQFMLASGQNSSGLEHSVPEQMFSTPDNPAEGISAVKALKIANDEGIPIYTIDQSNINTILPNLQLDAETITDIKNAANAGKVVTVSQTNITYNGWTGHGYIVIDPNTGAGAYMISGGLAGSMIFGTLLLILAGFFLLLTLFLSGPIALVGLALILLTAIFLAFTSLSIPFLYGKEKGSEFFKCFYGIDIAQNATKQITRFLKSLGTIIQGVLTAVNVYKFGQCLRAIIEK